MRQTVLLALSFMLAGCGAATDNGGTLRLVDRFDTATKEDAPAPGASPVQPMEWRADAGWRGHGVAGLSQSDGRLVGRAESPTSVVHVERDAAVDEDDLVHSVEVAILVREGGELSVTFDDKQEPDVAGAVNSPFPWPFSAPLVAGDEVQRYTLRPARPMSLSSVRHVLLRPTDVEGATFEVESVRVVSRREHLTGIASGVGWHGMGHVFHESIVTKAPETVSFPLTLPHRPWLDLALATIEEGAATFRVEAQPSGGEPLVFERTVTLPHRWNPVQVPLEPLAGREVTLRLSLKAEREGFLGFWGTAAVRSGLPVGERPRSPQGVIVVLADTLRSDHLDSWGYSRPTAPVLASLAAGGARARDCISQATWTKVSVPAIMTSLYPTTHTVKEFTDRLPASADTLAERFREEGYATLALTSISFTGQFTNLHQGYEELHESSSLQASSNSKTAREYMDRLLPWLGAHRDVPFFVFLHIADPHSPYRAYAPFDERWGRAEDADTLDEHTERVRPHIENPIMKRFGMPTRVELEQAGIDPEEFVRLELDAYDGSILAMDVELRRLLERLAELGLDDRTLLAFVSDHGTEFLDHDRHFHGQSVYGELNRVPMLLWGPGFVPSGVTLEPTVQTIDLMPTLLELAGLEAPPGLQGRSLVPLMHASAEGREQEWPRPAVTEKAIMNARDLPGRHYESTAFIVDGWKLIRNHPAPEGINEYELYDHRADPLNRNDLAADQPERVREIAALLEDWQQHALAERLDDASMEGTLDDQELERLRSLGYLQ